MQCPKCQTQNPDNSIECKNCGVIFAKIKKRQIPNVAPPKPKSNQTRMAVWISLCCIVISAGIYLFLDTAKSDMVANRFTDVQICSAWLSTAMRRPLDSISIDKIENKIVYLSYVRESDQSKWDYKCWIVENKIMNGAATGRWRTDKNDPVYTFDEYGHVLEIQEQFQDGSSSLKKFMIDQF